MFPINIITSHAILSSQPHAPVMNTVSTRDRTVEDDINSVRHESTVRVAENGLSIPSQREGPLIIWGDSVKRESLSVNDEILKSCMKWPRKTENKCHNCTHVFDGIPVPLPMHKDELRNIYYCTGNFCSWQCSKAFNLRETPPAGRGNRNMFISILAYKTWVKILRCDPDLQKKTKTFCDYKIDPARPRTTLRDFGGTLTIDEYREGFCGVLPPEESIVTTSPLLTLRKIAIVPFIDTSIVKSSAPVKNTEQDGLFRGIRRIETNRVQEFSNSFCERLKNAKADPTLMKRKKASSDANTLVSSMGIKINKRARS